MTYRRWAARLTTGLVLISGFVVTPVAMADPSHTETFQGCVLDLTSEQLTIRANEGPEAFNLTRMPPITTGVKTDDCITVRAYPGAGPEVTTWFAESIQQGDERIETSGRDNTKETTNDSPAKPKKKNED